MLITPKKPQGFTIIELLIVIVIIAILAAITLVAYNGITDRAQASQIETIYAQTNKAFHLVAVDQGWSTWPIDTSITGGANPTLQAVAATSMFKNYMGSISTPSGVVIRYDNDGDSINGCSVNYYGVDLFATGISKSVAQDIDNDIDDSNLSCGKVAYDDSSSQLILFLSFAQGIR